MVPASSTLGAQDGPWVARWLSQERLTVYLAATATRADALALYEWNCEASTALFRDLGHLEVALRNAYNHAIESVWTGPGHWTDNPSVLFGTEHRTRRGHGGTRVPVDINDKNREILTKARRKATDDAAPVSVTPGKIVAELWFGFWRFLTDRSHETSLWTPYLRHAFAAGTNRRDVDDYVQGLHRIRNRVAHHEPLFTSNLVAQRSKMVTLADLIDPALSTYITSRSDLTRVIATRPQIIP